MVQKEEPAFEGFKGKSMWLMSSEYAYVARWSHIWMFLTIYANPKGLQSFTIEFGWSKLLRYPEVVSSEFCDSEPNPKRFQEPEYMDRIRVFLGEDTWWYLEDQNDLKAHFDKREISDVQANERVQRALRDIRPTLVSGILPFLREASEWGTGWNKATK
jgi:hypothetical protein